VKGKKIDWATLEDSAFDEIMGESTGAGTLFGVMDASLRTASQKLTGQPCAVELEALRAVRRA
jgi:hypothetical protein